MIHRRVTVSAIATLLISVMVGCSDEEPRTGNVGSPPSVEEESNEVLSAAPTSAPQGAENRAPSEPTQYGTAEEIPEDVLTAELANLVSEFLRLSDEAMATGDTSAAREMTTPDCKPCWDQLDYTDQVHADGNQIIDGEYSQDFDLEIIEVIGNRIEAVVQGSYDALQIVDRVGNELESYEETAFTFHLGIDRDPDGSYLIVAGDNHSSLTSP